MSDTIKTAEIQKTDEEIIKNLDLLMNLEVLEEPELWDDLVAIVISDEDADAALESEK